MQSMTRLNAYIRLVRLDKPIGIWLLLWPVLWAAWLASAGNPQPWVLLVLVLGTVLMRSAGCAINDYADRHIDPHVARTRHRPLAAGELRPQDALLTFALLSLLALTLVLSLNPLSIALAVPGAVLAASYPYAKRWLPWPQAYLGLAFAWGVPMAFAAQTHTVPPTAFWLFGATVTWALAYDTLYALIDRDDDLKLGIHSSAIWLGHHALSGVALFQALTLLQLAGAGWTFGLGYGYAASLIISGGLFSYQLWLAQTRGQAGCFAAFLHNRWVGLVVFVGLAVDLAWT